MVVKKTLTLTSVIILICFVTNCKSTKNIYSVNLENGSLLAAYGEYVYHREGCANCHAQNLKSIKKDLVSLDGLGGKYSDSYLYYLLVDPESVMEEPKMKPFPHLHETIIDEIKVAHIIQKKLGKRSLYNLENYVNDLYVETDQRRKDLFKNGAINSDRSEIVALIAYLQELPASDSELKRQKEEATQLNSRMLTTENEVAIILKDTPKEIAVNNGSEIFKINCSPCHGTEAQGIVGPNLTDEYWLHGGSESEIIHTIINGHPEKGMLNWGYQLKANEIASLVAYIRAMQGSNPENAREPEGVKE